MPTDRVNWSKSLADMINDSHMYTVTHELLPTYENRHKKLLTNECLLSTTSVNICCWKILLWKESAHRISFGMTMFRDVINNLWTCEQFCWHLALRHCKGGWRSDRQGENKRIPQEPKGEQSTHNEVGFNRQESLCFTFENCSYVARTQ